nr:MAG TPA: hypothetical protein [Herelleviridae sp.]
MSNHYNRVVQYEGKEWHWRRVKRKLYRLGRLIPQYGAGLLGAYAK